MRSVPFGRSFPLIKKDILTASLPLLLWILQDFTGTVLEKVESLFSFLKIKKFYKFYNQHKIIKERKIDCEFEEKSAYVYSLNEVDNIKKEVEAANKLGISAEFV